MTAWELSKVMKRDEHIVECKIVEQTLLTFRKSSCHNTLSRAWLIFRDRAPAPAAATATLICAKVLEREGEIEIEIEIVLLLEAVPEDK